MMVIDTPFNDQFPRQLGAVVKVSRSMTQAQADGTPIERTLARGGISEDTRVEAKSTHRLRLVPTCAPGEDFCRILGSLAIRGVFIGLSEDRTPVPAEQPVSDGTGFRAAWQR